MHKTAYDMRISDWSSDVCSSDLWLDHHAVGALGEILCDLAQRFLGVRGVHLIGLLVALEQPARADRVAERAIEGRGIFGGVAHDLDMAEALGLERLSDRPDAAVHHVAGRDDVGAGARLIPRLSQQLCDRPTGRASRRVRRGKYGESP